MDKMQFDKDFIKKLGLPEDEALLLYLIYTKDGIEKTAQSLMNKKLIKPMMLAGYILTSDGNKYINKHLYSKENKDSLRDIAKAIIACYPLGTREGTSKQWRGNEKEIADRLRLLQERNDFTFTKEEAVKATEEYVKSFNGQYTYMMFLKYFVIKIKYDEKGNSVIESALQDYIENTRNGGKNVNENNSNWTTVIR